MNNIVKKVCEIESRVLSTLKDFQLATVERIDYLYRHGQRRVLVADEVGLGKTLIARGTVAKMAKLRLEEGDQLFKVVYVCSNAAIADQNLRKLRISSNVRTENASSSRLSMQHLNIFKQEHDAELLKNYIQLIPLTPDTSFRMTSGVGTVSERALIYAILRRVPSLKSFDRQLEIAMMDIATTSWNQWAKNYYESEVIYCDRLSHNTYIDYMIMKLDNELIQNWIENDVNKGSYLDNIIELCYRIKNNNNQRVYDNSIIRQIRTIFAKISLEKIDADLVIMDEFQRFKYIINSNNDTEVKMLADRFFQSADMRILLLSATPYKMYSTLDEIEENNIDEHYTEFLTVMNFLNNNKERNNKFSTIWKNYSVKLKEIRTGDTSILAAKKAAEDAMYQNVCRTERMSSYLKYDFVDDSDVKKNLEPLDEDIILYIESQKLLNNINIKTAFPIDYIKSSPYLMSFMRDYQIKRMTEQYIKKNNNKIKFINNKIFWVNPKIIKKYNKIPLNNARLQRIMENTLPNGMEKLLWIPPSKPYYELGGVFKNKELISKTLVFSSWEMVPRMLSCIISYEAERKTVGKLAMESNDEIDYFFKGDKRYPSARMTFTVSGDKKSAMNLFCLIYPSDFLINCYDPIECMNEGIGIKKIKYKIKSKIKEELSNIKYDINSKRPDNKWYYLVPLLLDNVKYVKSWFESIDQKSEYYDDDKTKNSKGFLAHLNYLAEQYLQYVNDGIPLGKMPKNLLEVLSDMALASPAICFARTLRYYLKNDESLSNYIPSDFARLFINRMNTAESTAAVELAYTKSGDEKKHWRNLLKYCRDGNLQSVLDEYVHLLSSGIDSSDSLTTQIFSQIKEAMNIRTTLYNVDTFDNFKKRVTGKKVNNIGIRTHYAVAFTKSDGKETDIDRKKVLRNAFNSPFRPFVLATTSIGQEGLDFHNYCRRIVHWNLPSNPIDLEQREGRINRFKCLAIRQNIAKRYGNISFSKDVWLEMFGHASSVEKGPGVSDLIPYWRLKKTDVKIERIVPMYPFSLDGLAYERLIKILSLYRLTLGQPRQEELLEHVFENCTDINKLENLFLNLSPFAKQAIQKDKL